MKINEGKLSAIIRRTPCQFDGDTWTTPDADLTDLLNDATDTTPKTHSGIKELAELVVAKVGLTEGFQILTAEQASIPEIPPDAIA